MNMNNFKSSEFEENNLISPVELLAERIYGGLPTKTFLPVDKQGFLSDPGFFQTIIEIVKPLTIIEVGSWKGHSAILMAEILDKLGLHSARILCVDTWLGSIEHWLNQNYREQMDFCDGYPSLYKKFLTNVVRSGYGDYIIPFPMISSVAAKFFQHQKIKADLIYIDAGHDYESVWNDLQNFYPLLNQDGIICGDDFPFAPTGEATRDFAEKEGLGLMVKGRKSVLFREDQFSKFNEESSLNLLIKANSFVDQNSPDIYKLLPINKSESTIVNSKELIFDIQDSNAVYLFEFADEETGSIQGCNSLIESACYPPSSINLYGFTNDGYIPHVPYLAQLQWTLLFIPESFIISQLSKYWQESLYLVCWQNLPITYEKGKEEMTLNMKNVRPRIIKYPTILLTSSNSLNNYYHWHLDILPIAFSLKDEINSGNFSVISHQLKIWQKVSLEILGIDVSKIIQAEKQPFLCRSLIYSSHLAGQAFQPPLVIKSMFREISRVFWEKLENIDGLFMNYPELIFISREDTHNRRSLLNETEIFDFLETLGFVKVVPGNLSYREQVEIFSCAKLIISPHGAGLTNMGFAPPNCKIIEIFSSNYVNKCYWYLASLLGHQYAYIVSSDQKKEHNAEFTVPLSDIVKTVHELLENHMGIKYPQ